MNTSTDIETKRNLAKAIYTKHQRIRTRPIDYFVPQHYQQPFFDSDKRNKGVIGGNRSGKTISGISYVIKHCLRKPNQDWWAATWADMSIPIQQKGFWDLLPKDKSIKYARFTDQRGFSNKIIMFENGSKIRFKTYDQGRESFQGALKDGILLDEEPPEDIVSECRARLIDRNGEMIRTMTPLNGITYTYDELVLNESNNKEVEYWFWDNRDNKKRDQDSLQNIISQYPTKEAEVRQTGHFINLTTGNAYYPFTDENIIEHYQYLEYRPLEISCDFNIDLMTWNISQSMNDMDYVFDFVELEGQANTDLLCQMLKSKEYEISPGKFTSHKSSYIFYVDIAGSQRHPEASKTNIAIIQENFPNAQIYYQNIRNIKDRIDAVNARTKNSKGEIKLKITKNCKRLIKDLRQVTWEMLLNKNKAKKMTHCSDGLSYQMFWKYPLTPKMVSRQW
jgi:phage terminase large subunit-like protein